MIPEGKINELRQCLERQGFKTKGHTLRGNSPFRAGSDSQGFVVCLANTNGNKPGWYDHVSSASGRLADLAAHFGIADFENTKPSPDPPEGTEYVYTDEQAKPIYKVLRQYKDGKKSFPQQHFCSETKDWQWGITGKSKNCNCPKVQTLPYHLAALAASSSAETILIVEGEKDVHTAEQLGFVATCNSGGAGKWNQNIPEGAYRYFENRNIVVIADNDRAGIEHAETVAKSLVSIAETVKIVRFDGPKGYDLTDWIEPGNGGNDLLRIIDDTPLYDEQDARQVSIDNPLLEESADDEGNAQCVKHLYGKTFLYTDELGWLKYNGTHWKAKGAGAALNRAIVDTLKQRRTLAVQADNEKLVRAAKPGATNSRNCRYMFQDIVWTSIDDFDNNPDLLNVKNGVVNLMTGELTPHDYRQRFTYCIDTAYDPNADDTQWVEWLHSTVLPQGADDNGQYVDLVQFIQMAVGYSLTGHTHEQCLFYLQGPPRAGKGIFLQILNRLLGRPLASGVIFDTFTAKRGGDNQNFDLAPLKSCRLITASESERTSLLNASLVKTITGNDPIRAAFKHKTAFEYVPQFKIWLSSNFRVMAQADDDALWSRLRIIHFPNSHLGKEDFNLLDRLWQHRTSILKWAIDGGRAWYKRKAGNIGLGHPAIITEAVNAHRDENDTVAQFIDDCCVIGDDNYAVGAQLSTNYKVWCQENGLTPLGGRRLSETLRRKGYTYAPKWIANKTKKCWLGIGLEV